MSTTVAASDWETQGVAQVGGAAGLGGAMYLFVFRSRSADCRALFVFIGAGVGLGGSVGGASVPSPSDILQNVSPYMWTSIPCTRAFAATDLDVCYGAGAWVRRPGHQRRVGRQLVRQRKLQRMGHWSRCGRGNSGWSLANGWRIRFQLLLAAIRPATP